MKNRILIAGDVALVELNARDREGDWALVDADDLPLLEERTWCCRGNGTVQASQRVGEEMLPPLHRWLVEAGSREHVRFRNGDRLDFRRNNLEIVSRTQTITVDGPNAVLEISSHTYGTHRFAFPADLREEVARHQWFISRDRVTAAITAWRNRPNRLALHHLVIGVPPPSQMVDHIDGNTLNNTRENLRFVTAQENQQNRHGANRNNRSSGYRGVHRARDGKYNVTVWINRKGYHVGRYPTPEEADAAARAYRAKHMPASPEARAAAP